VYLNTAMAVFGAGEAHN